MIQCKGTFTGSYSSGDGKPIFRVYDRNGLVGEYVLDEPRFINDVEIPIIVDDLKEKRCHFGWINPNYQKFWKQMKKCGRELEIYFGRSYYFGPAVRCEVEEFQDIVRETTMRLQQDQMGRSGIIVYPA